MIRLLVEAIRVYWSLVPRGRLWPSKTYLQWRLGTVYGSFNADGSPRPVRELLRAAWRDRKQVARFLAWRQEMRR